MDLANYFETAFAYFVDYWAGKTGEEIHKQLACYPAKRASLFRAWGSDYLAGWGAQLLIYARVGGCGGCGGGGGGACGRRGRWVGVKCFWCFFNKVGRSHTAVQRHRKGWDVLPNGHVTSFSF